MNRLKAIQDFLLQRMAEPSTWQGVGFIVSVTGSKFGAGLDWGQAAAVGGFISAGIKTIFPDKLK